MVRLLSRKLLVSPTALFRLPTPVLLRPCAARQRVDATEAWGRDIWACPHCGGNSRGARPWEEVRIVNPAYPERPEAGAWYA